MINYSKANKINMLFITNDVKKDWWEEDKGVKNPRVELRKEFYKETGMMFNMMTQNEFVKYSAEKYDISNTEQLQTETQDLQLKVTDFNLDESDMEFFTQLINKAENAPNSSISNELYFKARKWAKEKSETRVINDRFYEMHSEISEKIQIAKVFDEELFHKTISKLILISSENDDELRLSSFEKVKMALYDSLKRYGEF